jgi:8-amino-7-oxononanoate synthase
LEICRRDKEPVEKIEEFIKRRERQGLLRTLRPISLRRDGKIYLKGREYIDFSSNDYLGLSGHPKLIEVSKKALDDFGTASSASRLMSGDLQLHHQLEDKIAKFKNKEAGLVFNSGYQANAGIISALFRKGDVIFSDRLVHASIIDGIILSQAKFFRFRHNDMGHLETLLKKERAKFNQALIITESIFSMDGDKAPLRELMQLKERHNCQIFVDEAHATGIFGRNGSGVVEEYGLEEKIDFIMGTFSKALAGFGAYLAASKKIVDYLINTCRSFIFSTALPPSIVSCNLAGIDLVRQEPWRRIKLLEQAQYFRDRLRKMGFKTKGGSQIVPVILGDNLRAIKTADLLQENGFWVLPIREPTVPKDEARLRFSVTTYHNKEILDKAIDVLLSARI